MRQLAVSGSVQYSVGVCGVAMQVLRMQPHRNTSHAALHSFAADSIPRLRPVYVQLGARAVTMKAELHPQAVGNITWVTYAAVCLCLLFPDTVVGPQQNVCSRRR